MMKFKGIMPALVTPLNADESINIPVLEKLMNYLIDGGADGFYVAGATGEGLNLRPNERKVLAENAVRIADHKKPIIIQVASTDFSTAVDLAKHAEAVGADAISSTAPIFFKYDEDDVYNYYKALANSVNIPVMIYYSPAANFSISAKFAARMFEIDNITAIKWTSSDYYQMMMLKNLTHGEMNIINGPDEMLLMGLSAGADGGIGTTYNFQLSYICAVYDAFMRGDMEAANKAQREADNIINALLTSGPTIPATKAVLEAMGFEVGSATFPMKRFTDEQKAKIVANVKAAGWRF